LFFPIRSEPAARHSATQQADEEWYRALITPKTRKTVLEQSDQDPKVYEWLAGGASSPLPETRRGFAFPVAVPRLMVPRSPPSASRHGFQLQPSMPDRMISTIFVAARPSP